MSIITTIICARRMTGHKRINTGRRKTYKVPADHEYNDLHEKNECISMMSGMNAHLQLYKKTGWYKYDGWYEYSSTDGPTKRAMTCISMNE